MKSTQSGILSKERGQRMLASLESDESTNDELHAISKIDKTIHEPARLKIMAQLFVVERADFLFLQKQTQMTPGNLSAHLSKLESAGYIQITKEFIERKPLTALALTKKGRIAFKQYHSNLRQIIDQLPE